MGFEVKPLRHYDGAHYPSPEEPEAERERPLSLKLLVVFFSLAMALGLMACVEEEKAYYAKYYKRAGDSGPNGDGDEGDYDILLGAPPECTPGEAFCDQRWYAECTDGYYLEYTDCDAYCQAQTGMDALACDATKTQPCECYDILIGDVAECMPGDVRCIDTGLLGVCNDNHYEDIESCDTRCQEQLGEFGYSLGCDAAQADPCQCHYDMIDGGMTECMPGDVSCGPDNTVGTCDNYYYEYVDCDTRCQQELGDPFAYSLGCDPVQVDPCQCQYDMIDGGMAAECMPGDVNCGPDNTVGTCDNYWFEYMDCDQYCREYMGTSTATSQGCDALDAVDPCTCVDEGGPG